MFSQPLAFGTDPGFCENLQLAHQGTESWQSLRQASGGEQSSGTAFGHIASIAYTEAFSKDALIGNERRVFDIKAWVEHRSQGGLGNYDRIMLAQYYSNASSVFEYGIGESTAIAAHVGVPRFVGVDSDPEWVSIARDKGLAHFRFHLADIGTSGMWGFPVNNQVLPKQVLNYQLAPLIVEPQAFDVYTVDGRWRLACMLACFLHSSARGAPHDQSIVLIHDCERPEYHRADHVLNLVEKSQNKLCVYKRKQDTTDADLEQLWKTYMHDMA